MAIEPGLKSEYRFEVTPELTTDVAGTVPTPVLATPRMIGVMERTAMLAVWPSLPEGATCVGFEVCIRHVAGAPLGSKCVARAELKEVVEGRKLRFDVEVEHEGRTIGVGTHERRIVFPEKVTGDAPRADAEKAS